ncbi:MAG TPA: glycosyltransferase [Chthoniobacterales bacterium]
MPKVSILVPNYNYARFLDQRLESIERQTYKDFEMILLDDASADDSAQILKRFAREHHCQLVCNEHNSGNAFKQWNKGLNLATGQYVWIAEADDYADERFLEILVGRLEQNPECGLAYCNSSAVDDSGHIIDLVRPTMYDVDLTRWQRDFVGSGREECIRYLIRENTIQNASAVVFKRELCDGVGGADESLKLASDWKFWASLLCVSDLAFVATPLNYFRKHGSSVRAKTPTWMQITEALQVMKYIMDRLDVPRDALEDLHARLAIVLLHASITQRPSTADLAQIRELTRSLQFGFSLRAASGFTKQVLQAIAHRLHGARVK